MTTLGLAQPSVRLSEPWFGHAVFRPPSTIGQGAAEAFGYNLGPNDVANRGLALLAGKTRFDSEFKGGRVLVVDGTNPISGEGLTVSGWMGPWNTAYCFHYRPFDRTDDILSLYDRSDFVDTPEGLTVAVHGWQRSRVVATLPFHDFGRLEVLELSNAVSLIPSWEGAAVPAGRLWQIDRIEEGQRMRALLIVSDTALATFVPMSGTSMQALVDFTTEIITLAWDVATS